jgi:hypothetical protein
MNRKPVLIVVLFLGLVLVTVLFLSATAAQPLDSYLPVRYETGRSDVHYIVTMDTNNDAYEDVLLGTQSGVMLALGGSAGLEAPSDIWPSLSVPIAWMSAGDDLVNSHPGVLIATQEISGNSTLYISELSSSGLTDPVAIGEIPEVASGAILDIDNDSDNDACFGTLSTGEVYKCLNLGASLSAPESLFNSSQTWMTAMLGGDFNSDGLDDLVIGTDGPGLLVLCWNNGTHLEPNTITTVHSEPNDNWVTSLAKGDFNNDAHLDLAVSAASTATNDFHTIIVFPGNGSGLDEYTYTMFIRSYGYPRSLTATDFNADGFAELIYTDTWVYIQSDVAAPSPSTFYTDYRPNAIDIIPFDPVYVTYPDLFPFGQQEQIDTAISALATPDFNGDTTPDLVYITRDNGYLYAYHSVEGEIYDPYTEFIRQTRGLLNPEALKAFLSYLSGFFISLVLLWFYSAERENYLRGDKFWDIGFALIFYVILYILRFGLLLLPPSVLSPLYQIGLISFLGSSIANYLLVFVFGLILIVLLMLSGVDPIEDFVGTPAAWCTLLMGILVAVFWVVFALTSLYPIFLSAVISSILYVFVEIILETLKAQERLHPILKAILSLIIWVIIVSVIGGVIDAWLGV